MTYGYHSLPDPLTRDGTPRRVGVELEFSGLSAPAAAEVAAHVLGGTPGRTDDTEFTVRGAPIGDIRVELDTSLDENGPPWERLTLAATRPLIPIEIVLPPIEPAKLAEIDALVRALAAAGAQGTEARLGYAFGMHFNVACKEMSAKHVWNITRAFALLEDVIRAELDIDNSRRALPFVDPFPRAFVDLAADHPDPEGLSEIADHYLGANPTRNRALDLTPILAMTEEDMLVETLGADHSVSARPAFHYRLPDCRIGEPGWTLHRNWAFWVLVETVAADEALLEALADAWRTYRASWWALREEWKNTLSRRLSDTEHWKIVQ